MFDERVVEGLGAGGAGDHVMWIVDVECIRGVCCGRGRAGEQAEEGLMLRRGREGEEGRADT